MASASNAVFATVELHESILHNLPTKDLLFAQLVSKQWKAAIDKSPKLQRALFLQPVDLELLTLKWDCTYRVGDVSMLSNVNIRYQWQALLDSGGPSSLFGL